MVLLPPVPSRSEWPALQPRAIVTSRSELLPPTMTRSVVLLQLESVLISIACITTGAQVIHAFTHVLKRFIHVELATPLTDPGITNSNYLFTVELVPPLLGELAPAIRKSGPSL